MPLSLRFRAAAAGVVLAVGLGAMADGGGSPVVDRAGAAVADFHATPEPGSTPEPGGTPDPGGGAPAPGPEVPPDPEPAPGAGGSLAIGITEPNPSLIWPAAARPVAEAFAPWRDAVTVLRPHFYRLQLDWGRLQPRPHEPLTADHAEHGCLRDRLPCAPWLGLREQLAALAARQAEGGWETVVTISGTPAWAAREAHGCERPGTGPRSRMPRPEALGEYRRMIVEVLALAAATGAELRWWNAWNEPNHPYFMSPQRLTCDAQAPSQSVPAYLDLHAELERALEEAPGDQRRVLGDLAGIDDSREDVVSVSDFITELPRDVVCATPVWAQHSYLSRRNDARAARRALAAHDCSVPHQIWVTETGARNAPSDPPPHRRCRSMNARMRVWRADPQVTVAFQYTVREDDRFPYGLVATDLTAAYPILRMWQAWGGGARPHPSDPPPETVKVCPEP